MPVLISTQESKHEIRWELANINNRLNKLLKDTIAMGPRNSLTTEVHELRIRRDTLLAKLQNL